MLEQRERQSVLVAVERPVRLADHNRVELAVRVLEFGEQRGCLRAALPRNRARLVHVEELGDDHPVPRVDERAGTGELPSAGRLGVLLVLGGHPAVERESDHWTSPCGLSLSASWSWALRRIRSSTRAAAGLRGGGSAGRITRTVSVLLGVRRFAWARADLGLLSYGRFCDLRAAEQAFSSLFRLDIASRPATGDRWIKLWVTCLVYLSHRPRSRLYVQTRARRETRQVGETNAHRSPPSPALAARHRPRLTWTARPASACAARCRYRVGLVIPLARMSSAMSAPSSGASRRAAQSASSCVAGS